MPADGTTAIDKHEPNLITEERGAASDGYTEKKLVNTTTWLSKKHERIQLAH